MNADKTNIHRI